MRNILAGLCLLVACVCSWAQCTPVPTPSSSPPQVSTAGNYGRLTIYQGPVQSGTCTQVDTNVLGDFSMAIQVDLNGYYTSDADATAAGGGWVITYMPWSLYGSNGGQSCGRACSSMNYTFMPDESPTPVAIVPAVEATDANGNPVMGQGFCGGSPCTLQQWVPVAGTAQLADGTPAVFQHGSYGCVVQVGATRITSCDKWALNQSTNNVIRPGKYLVYVTGTGCSGRGCNIQQGAYFFSYIPVWGAGLQQHYVSTPTPPCSDCGDQGARHD